VVSGRRLRRPRARRQTRYDNRLSLKGRNQIWLQSDRSADDERGAAITTAQALNVPKIIIRMEPELPRHKVSIVVAVLAIGQQWFRNGDLYKQEF
jgi:hypothetical protein